MSLQGLERAAIHVALTLVPAKLHFLRERFEEAWDCHLNLVTLLTRTAQNLLRLVLLLLPISWRSV